MALCALDRYSFDRLATLVLPPGANPYFSTEQEVSFNLGSIGEVATWDVAEIQLQFGRKHHEIVRDQDACFVVDCGACLFRACACPGGRRTLTGTITDAQGGSVAGAKMSARNARHRRNHGNNHQ